MKRYEKSIPFEIQIDNSAKKNDNKVMITT